MCTILGSYGPCSSYPSLLSPLQLLPPLLPIIPLFFFPISNSDFSSFLFFSDASPPPPFFLPPPCPSPSFYIFDLFISLMRTWDLSYDLQGYLR